MVGGGLVLRGGAGRMVARVVVSSVRCRETAPASGQAALVSREAVPAGREAVLVSRETSPASREAARVCGVVRRGMSLTNGGAGAKAGGAVAGRGEG